MEAHINDLSLGTNTQEDHILLLQDVFTVFQENHLCIKLQQREFMCDEMEYLGFDVGYGWWKPGASKMQPLQPMQIRDAPKKGLQDAPSFIGACNFYWRHIQHFTYRAVAAGRMPFSNCRPVNIPRKISEYDDVARLAPAAVYSSKFSRRLASADPCQNGCAVEEHQAVEEPQVPQDTSPSSSSMPASSSSSSMPASSSSSSMPATKGKGKGRQGNKGMPVRTLYKLKLNLRVVNKLRRMEELKRLEELDGRQQTVADVFNISQSLVSKWGAKERQLEEAFKKGGQPGSESVAL